MIPMIQVRLLVANLCIAVFAIIATSGEATANDYVWTRTAFGSCAAGRHCSAMSNGYGGYYVPQNAVGNNYEASGNFKNPNGYIVPAQANTYSPRRRWFH
jgi:hypothetical protein